MPVQSIIKHIESPFELKVGFGKWLMQYQELLVGGSSSQQLRAEKVIEIAKEHPSLIQGFSRIEDLEKYQKEIAFILEDAFNPLLTNNEIRAAAVPFYNLLFNTSNRFKSILDAAGASYHLHLKNLSNDEKYILACAIILNNFYHLNFNFKRPFIYDIPDKNGIMRYYKVMYNADFIDIQPNEKAVKITDDVVNELLDDFDNIHLWKSKFPPGSYNFNGFVLANLFDVTDDYAVSNLKSNLLDDSDYTTTEKILKIEDCFRSLLGVADLKIGFSIYNKEDDGFERVYGNSFESFLLSGKEHLPSDHVLCSNSHRVLLEQKAFYSISDVNKYFKLSEGKAPQYATLNKLGFKSAILAPVANTHQLFGVLEIVSPTNLALNSLNANKLIDVLPYILTLVERKTNEEQNLIQAVIQKECTAIHPSVSWKFVDAAKAFIRAKSQSSAAATFKAITFENVYPLYGQIDVKGSSMARFEATKKDLLLQLRMARKILIEAIKIKALPIYQQMLFEVENYINLINENFQLNSEYQITSFLKNEVKPLFQLIRKVKCNLTEPITNYFDELDSELEVIYQFRLQFDETIREINEDIVQLLDQKEMESQKMYPHFFERFKTDGVEHNMYIGESITQNDSFDMVYLYNLRLWQLQVMCELENHYYNNRKVYPMSLDVTSLVLVFNQPLSIRFRTDEKRFDVDGTYNARYEIVKKRIDKAYIKGTTERITQKGKLTIVYSQDQDKAEYLKYVAFLQAKNVLNNEIEDLEIQDLQGVAGLKALRIGILYQTCKQTEAFYTYNDLIETIKH